MSQKYFTLTGGDNAQNKTRSNIAKMITDLGYGYNDKFRLTGDTKTTHLVCTDPNENTNKLKAAKQAGADLISYAQLYEILDESI